ncbi:MAG: response regulator transcription factor [Ghiorsea sp.]
MKLLIADDHALFRESLALSLQRLDEQEATIFQAEDGESTLQLANLHDDLDMILLDLDMPGMTGLEVIRLLQKTHAKTPIVMISANDEHAYITKALELGAKGFIPKTTSTDVTLSALRLVLSGGIYLPAQLIPHHPSDIYNTKEKSLTPRQMEILRLLQKGVQNKIIAYQLELSPSTVKVHVRRIFTTLGAKNRSEAVNNAVGMGILS